MSAPIGTDAVVSNGTRTRERLLARLTDPDAVIVFDGAMGTMLYQRGVFINQCYDELSLRAPDLVRGVHEEYVKAGAEVLETNSFGANRFKLAHFGLEREVASINGAAARVAREAAGDAALVAGAVGPLGVRLEPYGPTSLEEARAAFEEQIAALRDGGVDCLILETFADLDEVTQAVLAARAVAPALPLIAQMTVDVEGVTVFGVTPEDVARSLDALGADVIGLNCSVGPQIILEAIERMAAVTRRKLSAMPNAGMPREVGGRKMYMASPEYMATYARHLLQAGAKVIGGCCGTTPAHIHAMVEGIRPLVPRSSRDGRRETGDGSALARGERGVVRHAGVTPVPLADRSNWGRKLVSGEFVSSVEIVPPRGVDATRMLEDVRALKVAGVDAVNVPDGPRAQSRMGAMMTSLLIEQQVGIEAVCHYACRDRNLLGMLSDLLGGAAMGLHNLLLVTGDPPKMGPYPDATAVFDIDSIGLTNLVRNLNRGLDPGGNPIGAPTRYTIGVGVNPAAIDPSVERERFDYKVEAGAEFAITQPVFDPRQLERFLREIGGAHIPIVAGIWPLVSLRNAEFLANEVPGVVVPDEILERMRVANRQSAEHAVAEGIAIAREMLALVRSEVQGVQVSAPFGKVALALGVLE
ncbi:MAG TPA: bifunctional homocysteine S-methyltransferase/methylenetetrahydrofolate reductase [Gemmatimonadaceae bacterium]|jgi:methionine synthase I (cobalamin-dependent)/5,10-methylenetetrahydrofolate reductase|nr:bifunctional homocysteine S-methyltransferase/methylenetetrahydrofolate reductase [Gemmatimonadota bacterium]HNV74118.1 bifunctional homocysteine S-methyltransferase/methylenetetrahydrofolate reductase [Gemmatimonadaceae bacterium]HPV73882.1 bifunctional homocysteine S-methyltransferase/methylenetetrahydrofolate reductase [Gemmatimonadaceae bacterium]